MEASEKIYIPTILAANIVRFKEEGSIEYTRTDAFMEKVDKNDEDAQSQWKPTGEQMKAFHIALRLTEGETYRTALSLYDDLKKLVQWHEER